MNNSALDSSKGSELKNFVTIVLPTLNEEEAIGKVIDEIKGEGYNNILVIDGHSSDKTVEIAKSKGVNVIIQNSVGKASAVRMAIELVKTPYVLVMDADYTYDPKDIALLLERIPHYDEVIGFRKNRANIPALHRIGNRIISTVLSLLMGQRIGDPCSGMYLLKVETAKTLELTSSSFDIEAEIVAQLISLGKITEVPITYRRRIGKKKISLKSGFRILITIFKMVWLYNPIFLLSSFSSVLAIPGLVIILWQLYIRYIFGDKYWSLGLAWLGLVLLVIGLQGFSTATMLLLLKRMERRIMKLLKP